jgi:phosphoglycolate phosphatase-like HAD superfamily hydrolase
MVRVNPPPPPAELLNPHVRRGPFRAALFDFDGTLSLIREGWPHVMVGMMVEILRDLGLDRSGDWEHVEQFVMALNGHPTVVQTARFADEVAARGGTPADPREYLKAYLDRLMGVVRQRWEVLETGRAAPEAWVVPNAHAVLRNLQARGVPLFVASGTDYESVAREAALLGVAGFFGGEINAPKGGDGSFSKAAVIDRVLAQLGVRGEELVGFGDGVVETRAVKAVGGVAVGVASAEPGRTGVNPDKRDRLAAAGADLIVPDYARQAELLAWLWGTTDG